MGQAAPSIALDVLEPSGPTVAELLEGAVGVVNDIEHNNYRASEAHISSLRNSTGQLKESAPVNGNDESMLWETIQRLWVRLAPIVVHV